MSLTIEQVDDGFGIKIISYMINIAEHHQMSIIGNNLFSNSEYIGDETYRYFENYFANWCSISLHGTCIRDFYDDLISQYISQRWNDRKRVLIISPSSHQLDISPILTRKLDRMNIIYDDQFEPNSNISIDEYKFLKDNGFVLYKEAGDADSSLLAFYNFDDKDFVTKPFWGNISMIFDDIIHLSESKLIKSTEFYDFLIKNCERSFNFSKAFIYFETGKFTT